VFLVFKVKDFVIPKGQGRKQQKNSNRLCAIWLRRRH
jgi:hypothetical protein